MKFFIFSLMLLLALVQFSEQKARFINCSQRFQENHPRRNSCIQITCNDETSFSAVACAPYLCQHGYNGEMPENPDEVYPKCCGGPICID